MRLQHTVVVTGGRGGPTPTEVEVDAPPGATADELARALAQTLGDGPIGRPTICLDGVVIDGAAVLGHSPLVDGAALTLHLGPALPGPTRRAPARTPVAMAIAHGPDAGRTIELVPGVHTLGRGAEAAIVIDDPRISRIHAVVTVTADSVTLADVGSTNGTELDGAPVGDDPQPVPVGGTIQVGDTLAVLRDGGGVPAALSAHDDGTLVVNRRPRVQGASPPRSISMPSPPATPRAAHLPWVAMLLPLPVAGVMALAFGPMMLAFAVMSPLLMAGSAIGDRLTGRRRYAAEHAVHLRHRAHAEGLVRAACREEAALLARTQPDPAQTLVAATTVTAQVWERRLTDPDSLAVSVGWCSTPAALRVTNNAESDEAEHPLLHRVPCALPLADLGVVGICGERGTTMGTLRAALGQLATLHSPLDLGLVLLAGPGAVDEAWAWLGRLPHVRTPAGHPREGWLLHLDHAGTAMTGLATLADTVRRRLADDHHHSAPWQGPRTVVVLDGAAALRGLPDLAVVLEHGPSVGICVVAVDEDRAGLLSEARAVLDLGVPAAPALHLPGSAPVQLVVDQVGPWWADRLSRGLAPLRDAAPGATARALPEEVALCDVLGLEGPGTIVEELARAWAESAPSTSVPVGRTADGAFQIDLATDGPHALVAGTTGAGKSELLRTLVASLAVHHRPERLSMVLVDYKGGAAFRECAPLPHVAAVVTDLDEHLASRALVSLRAELKRRERLLAAAGVADFPSYDASPVATTSPLPRLVIVIDEFRALAEELPGFIDGMVAVAALGRSLGVHLVLATQRPAGVVTADIKANMNLRIGLRLRDRSDSVDVIDGPEAATLDPRRPGRALARVADGAVVAFQAAHASARSTASRPNGIRVRRLPWGEPPPSWPETGAGDAVTDLAVVVAAVSRAVALLGAQPAESPWLPALPAQLDATSLTTGAPRSLPIGLVDEPALQRQLPLEVRLDEPGHWGFVGSTGSGRSTALLTLASSAVATQGPSDLHVYAVSAGSLSRLQALPHCGAHVGADDVPRLDRLVARLSGELARRREALAASGHTTMGAWWCADPSAAPAALLLLVDDWDLLVQRTDDRDGGALSTRLLGLLREGASLGLTAAVAGDRALLVGRAAAALTHRVLLRMNDPTDHLLAGVSPRSVPAEQPPGRGLLPDGTEVQIATPRPLVTPPGRDPGPRRAWRVDALPESVSLESLAPTPARDTDPDDLVLIGIGGDELAPRGLSPRRDGRQWAVLGGPGSGVSTTLATIAAGFVAQGRRLVVVAAPSGAWESLREGPLVHWCDEPGRVEEIVAVRRRVPDLAVVVDDADRLVDTPMDAALREVAALVDRDQGIVVVGAKADAVSVQYRGLAVGVVRHRTGVLLGPTTAMAADLLGTRVPVDRSAPPGRGHLVGAGVAVPIQVGSTTVRK